MKYNIAFISALAYSIAFSAPVSADILQAKYEAPVLDGDGGDFTGDSLLTSTGVELKAAYDDSSIYVLAEWIDNSITESIHKKRWAYNFGSWRQSGDEDRLAIMWDINATGFPSTGCAALCHMDMMMRTWFPGETVDIWHWKAVRGNPMGYADDKYLDNAMDPSDPEAAHHGDAGSSTYRGNYDSVPHPLWMAEADPGADATFLVQSDAQGDFDPFGVIPYSWSVEVPFDTTAVFPENSTVSGYVLRNPEGSRADIQAAGRYTSGIWTLELRRALTTTGDTDSIRDVQFDDLGASYLFGVAVFDNSGGSDHLTDSGPHTLVFESTGVEGSNDLPHSTLPFSPKLFPNSPNPFTSETSIRYYLPTEERVTLTVYDTAGRHVKTLVSGYQTKGDHIVRWNGNNGDGREMESGLYFSVFEVGGVKFTEKMILGVAQK